MLQVTLGYIRLYKRWKSLWCYPLVCKSWVFLPLSCFLSETRCYEHQNCGLQKETQSQPAVWGCSLKVYKMNLSMNITDIWNPPLSPWTYSSFEACRITNLQLPYSMISVNTFLVHLLATIGESRSILSYSWTRPRDTWGINLAQTMIGHSTLFHLRNIVEIWLCWFSLPLLHTGPWTISVQDEGQQLMKPTGPGNPQVTKLETLHHVATPRCCCLVAARMLHHLFFMQKNDSHFSASLFFFRVQVSEELLHPHLVTPRLGAKQTKKCSVSEKHTAVCWVIRFPTDSGSLCDYVGDVGKRVHIQGFSWLKIALSDLPVLEGRDLFGGQQVFFSLCKSFIQNTFWQLKGDPQNHLRNILLHL